MRITKIFNNNVVGALDEKGREVVVVGRGVGFRMKAGESVPPAAIDKVFVLSPKYAEKFTQLIGDIPYDHIRVSDEIIAMAKEALGARFSENIYITLTDHISYAIERVEQGIAIANAMLWEIRNFYGPEFKVGEKAVDIVKRRLGVELGEDEAGFIALHFVNAMLDTSMRVMPEITGMIRDILAIVRDQFGAALDEESLSFRRFTTHLRYLGQRVFKPGEQARDDIEFDEVARMKYPEAYACAERIADYVGQTHGVAISGDDKAFLTVHIRRLTSPRE